MKIDIRTKEQMECEHNWAYSNQMLLSNPPQRNKICKNCGLVGRDRIGTYKDDDYDRAIEKFKAGII